MRLSKAVIPLVFLALFGGVAGATPVRDAHDQYARAQGEYYQTLRKLGPNATEEQKVAAREATLLPATQTVSGLILKMISDTENSNRNYLFALIVRRIPIRLMPEWARRSILGKGSAEPMPRVSPSPNSSPSPASTSATYRKKGLVLDGSGVPKYIEFQGTSREESQ